MRGWRIVIRFAARASGAFHRSLRDCLFTLSATVGLAPRRYGTNHRCWLFNWYPPAPENRTMNRNFLSFLAAVIVVPIALVLVGARLSSASSRTTPGPLDVPTLGANLSAAPAEDTAVFAGGCFWGVEAVFDHVRGVKRAISGYAGGTRAGPSYEQVSSGETGHAGSVGGNYDPSRASLGKLVQLLFSGPHAPTDLN